jgi:general secretion pathway protein D
MNTPRPQIRLRAYITAQALARRCAAGLLPTVFACVVLAQTATQTAPAGNGTSPNQNAATTQDAPNNATTEIPAPSKPAHVRGRNKERAAKLYLDSSKQFVNRQFEAAMQGFEKAASLDPSNSDYRLAAGVARGHAVTALIQAAAKDRMLGNESAARAELTRALALDPTNFAASQHLDELADEAARSQAKSLYGQSAGKIANLPPLLPVPAPHSFHLRSDQRQLIEQVFKAYGVIAMVDDSVRAIQVRLDVDNANFEEAAQVLGMATHTFYVPLDAHHVVVANDTLDNRQRFTPQQLETVYLAGLSDDEMNEVQTLAKQVFEIQQAQLSAQKHTITLRAPALTLDAFNTTMQDLLDGRSQVVLDVKLIQVAHTSSRNTGTQFPQSISAFNVLAEEESLLNANQSLVQQIISSGLASPNDPLAILGILIASGQVSSPLLSSGFALFGGGLTESALELGTTTFNLNLNTSDSRELDQIQLRLEDGQEGTLKEGERYPIQTSSYSSLSPNLSGLAGLTGAGTSSSLTSLLSSLASGTPNIPMVQYQDLGLTLKATPRVLRNDDVALSIDMTLDALSGQTIDGNPVLDNRAYSGVATLKEGEAAVIATEVDKSQSLAVSGTPGLSEIPGMNNLTEKDLQKDYATIVIVITPHVVRDTQAAGHTAMLRVVKAAP